MARGIVACIWCVALVPMGVFASYHTKSEFKGKFGRCLTDIYDNEAARGPVMTCIGVIVILPLFAITGINMGLLGVAARHSRSAGSSHSLPNFKALIMVCSLSGLFIVSWSPYLAFTFLKMRHPELPQVLDLVAFHFIFLNSFGNPILYTLTNRRQWARIILHSLSKMLLSTTVMMNNTSTSRVENVLEITTAQVVPLGVFCFFMALFGILGNGVVLYSSLRYNAIKLDKVSLVFVRNLALADILYTACVIVPQFVTYTVQRWVLGPVYCVIQGQVGIVPVSVNTLTVLAITGYRLKVVLSPFRDITVSMARGIVACIWCVALVPMGVFASYHTKSEFKGKFGRCLTDIYDNEAARGPVMTCIGVIVILPLFAITGINMGLLGVAARHSRSAGSSHSLPNFKALIMVCSLSGLFIVSWSPYLAFTFLKMRHPELPQVLDLVAFHFIFLNSFGNPILYTLTNRRQWARIILHSLSKMLLSTTVMMNNTSTSRVENVLEMTTAQVVPLGVFCFFMALFGILGNGVVLYSSLRYNAIKLDKVSLVFVRNLALADILYAVFTVVPSFVAYASRDWVLGPVYCFVSAQLSLFPGLVNSLLVMVIALYRLVLLYSPFTIPRCIHARVLSAGLWLFSMSPTIIRLACPTGHGPYSIPTTVCASQRSTGRRTRAHPSWS
eukprot:sb/3462736/